MVWPVAGRTCATTYHLPSEPGFELNKATGLGLSIVRTLVTTELDGTITMRAGQPDDFSSVGLGDHPRGTGTVVDLTVPV